MAAFRALVFLFFLYQLHQMLSKYSFGDAGGRIGEDRAWLGSGYARHYWKEKIQ